MVLYNGKKEWNAPVNFKDLVGDADKFGEYIVNFKYILVSVNKYSKEELYQIGNAISLMISLDQDKITGDGSFLKSPGTVLFDYKMQN